MKAVVFRVLGPLTLAAPRSVGGPKPRALLATLLLHVNEVVPVDLLVEVLWPDAPPRSAAANVRTYVHSLRRVLAGSGADIERRNGGYALLTSPDLVDRCVFEAEVSAAAAADGSDALAILDRACARWRGRPLADLAPSHVWVPELTRLTELWLSAQEQRMRLKVEAGDLDGAVAELRALLGEHPLREELWRLLVGALVAAGHTAEARHAVAEAEQVLRDELGVEPGPELRDLLDAETPVCQLPLDLPDFAGRSVLDATLRGHLSGGASRGSPTVLVLSGPPGVGKSAAAVRAAHAMRPEFPDGQLYVDLAGTSDRPRTPMDVLPELLRALGAPAVPRDLPERAALLRSRLARKRVLVVLDDAASVAQVQPLLPGAGRSGVLVTSRTALPDLTGARPVEVAVLDPPEAMALLEGLVGRRRVEPERDAAGEILRFCGFLPLAIRVVGTRLRHRPGWTLRSMADRLRDERRRLDELRVGDLEVRASVNLSYDLLTGDAARVLRWLGVLGPGQWPGWVAGALLGRHADAELEALVDEHLVELTASGRYRLHDLLRCYAAELAEQDPSARRRDAVRRVLEHYLSLAVAAADAMPIHFLGVYPTAPAPAVVPDPTTWFEAELAAGVAAVALAQEWGLDDLAWRVAAAFTPFFDLRGHHDEWQRTHAVALAAARRAGDRHGEAIVLRNLGQLALYRDEYADAEADFRVSAQLFGEVGDRRGAGFALAGLGTVARIGGEYQRALDHCHRALAMFTEAGDPHGEAVARLATGSVWLALGCLAPAGRWFADAHALAAATGDRHREAHALRRMAMLHRHRGDLATARDHTDRAVAIFEELRDDHCLGYTNQDLGELCLTAGDLPAARVLLGGALRRHRRSGDRRSEAEVVDLLGRLHAAQGDQAAADEHVARARAIRAAFSSPYCS